MPSIPLRQRLLLALALGAIPVLFACNFVSSLRSQGPGPGTATPGPGPSTDQTSTPTVSGQETLPTLDGGEIPVPDLAPVSYSALLEQQVEQGTWSRGEGIVHLLGYVTGEQTADQIPGFEQPEAASPTGLLRHAYEYLDSEQTDPGTADDIERLLGILVPDPKDLDRLSQPAESAQARASYTVSQRLQGGTPAECASLQGEGFDAELDPGEHCFVYEEINHDGSRLRFYYPKWWPDYAERFALVGFTRTALLESIETFREFGTFKDVNVVFGTIQSSGKDTTNAYVAPFDPDETCPVTILPLGRSQDLEAYDQTIAHEAFHCFQGWNFDHSFYSDHDWWSEGSASYFSNVVYPQVNKEHRWIDNYYYSSLSISWFEMEYQTEIAFQFLGNRMGNNRLVELIERVSAQRSVSGQEATLANYPDMGAIYHDFLVATMSSGVTDSGGGHLLLDPFPLKKTVPVQEEGHKEFSVEPFVAGRFGLRYLPELRVLEEPVENANLRHSAARKEVHDDPSAWSELPPEIRTSCERDTIYGLALSAVQDTGEFTADVHTVEQAECDPCLLGTWRLDYATHPNMTRTLEQAAPGSPIDFQLAGYDYLRFDDQGEVNSRLADLTITMTGPEAPPFHAIANSNGEGDYSADGEVLNFIGHQTTAEHILYQVEGFGTFESPPEILRASVGDFETPNLLGGGAGETVSISMPYVCSEQTLTLTNPVFGEQVLDRTDEIIPTPIPTASGTD